MENHIRVRVPLVRDPDSSWPPSDAEYLWAKRLADGTFEVDNIPVYARGLSCGDIIIVADVDTEARFVSIVRRGGHSTYRVILLNSVSLTEPPTSELWDALDKFGCSYEGLNNGPLYAIDVPPEASIRDVYGILEDGERRGVWDFEEANLEHTP